MSTTTQAIDAREYLAGWLNGLVGMFSADINAIPDDKWTANFGGCTRPCSVLAADAVILLDWTAKVMRGETPSGDPYSETGINDQCGTKEGAIAILGATAEEFNSALKAASDEALSAMVTPPWQMPAPLFAIAQIAVSHVWYHDGQLNYVQCLLGDDKIHWMG